MPMRGRVPVSPAHPTVSSYLPLAAAARHSGVVHVIHIIDGRRVRRARPRGTLAGPVLHAFAVSIPLVAPGRPAVALVAEVTFRLLIAEIGWVVAVHAFPPMAKAMQNRIAERFRSSAREAESV